MSLKERARIPTPKTSGGVTSEDELVSEQGGPFANVTGLEGEVSPPGRCLEV